MRDSAKVAVMASAEFSILLVLFQGFFMVFVFWIFLGCGLIQRVRKVGFKDFKKTGSNVAETNSCFSITV